MPKHCTKRYDNSQKLLSSSDCITFQSMTTLEIPQAQILTNFAVSNISGTMFMNKEVCYLA